MVSLHENIPSYKTNKAAAFTTFAFVLIVKTIHGVIGSVFIRGRHTLPNKSNKAAVSGG
jgi:hypothetical protein